MELQNRNYFLLRQGSSWPGTLPTDYPTDWRATQPQAGSDMARNGSNDSAYYSARTEYSDETFSQEHSPGSLSHNASSPSPYKIDTISAQQYLQQPQYSDLEPSQRLSRFSSERDPLIRPTLSALGWTPESNYLQSYKFVIPKGREPYFKLLYEGYPSRNDMPEKVFLDVPKNHTKNEFPCLYPGGCEEGKIFKRPADLERHYRALHGPPDQKENFFCDYSGCKTRGPFTRKDHFRDHLRDYHKEDIAPAKKSGRKKVDDKKWFRSRSEWLADRRIEAKWWRCPKCLERISIADSFYDCLTCRQPCDKERMERIEAVRATKVGPSTYVAPASPIDAQMIDLEYGYSTTPSAVSTIIYPANCNSCVECGGTGYSVGSWDACRSCSTTMEQYYSVEDARWDDQSYSSRDPSSQFMIECLNRENP